jgi:cell division protease FtsH
LDKEEIAEIFAPVAKRPARPAWTGSTHRIPSDRPAIDYVKPTVAAEERNPETPASE